MIFVNALFVRLTFLYLIVLGVDLTMTFAACTVNKNGYYIPSAISGDVATCTDSKCQAVNADDEVLINGCRLVNCTTDLYTVQYACARSRITNTDEVICTNDYACFRSRMSNVKNVTCTGLLACRGSSIETIPGGVVNCQTSAGKDPACASDGLYAMKIKLVESMLVKVMILLLLTLKLKNKSF